MCRYRKAGENWGGIFCLCPGFVATDANSSERDQPESAAPGALDERSAEDEIRKEVLRRGGDRWHEA